MLLLLAVEVHTCPDHRRKQEEEERGGIPEYLPLLLPGEKEEE